MPERFVTYDIAVTAKELGFNKECLVHIFDNILYMKNGYEAEIDYVFERKHMTVDEVINIPLWQELIDWIRTEHNLSLSFIPYKFEDDDGLTDLLWYYCLTDINVNYPILLNEIDLNASDFNCGSYEEARMYGVMKALETIKENLTDSN